MSDYSEMMTGGDMSDDGEYIGELPRENEVGENCEKDFKDWFKKDYKNIKRLIDEHEDRFCKLIEQSAKKGFEGCYKAQQSKIDSAREVIIHYADEYYGPHGPEEALKWLEENDTK